jgi:alpha-tubulin suppressor-like RCC1 family protein
MPLIAAGSKHFVGLRSDGTVWAWGDNAEGQLGDGTRIQRRTPVPVLGPGGLLAVAAGEKFSMALHADGTVWTWGSNEVGQLGDGTTTGSTAPVQVVGLSEVAAIAAGGLHAEARKTSA